MTTATHGVTEQELANLSDAERQAIEDESLSADAEILREIAGEGEGEGDRRPRLPRYDVKPVEKYHEQMATLDKQHGEVVQLFTAGDIELSELLAKQRELDAKRADLRDQKLKADVAVEFNVKAGQTEWLADVQDFFARTKETESIDYTKPLLNAAFDTALKTLASDQRNADRSAAWFLREAHKLVQADIGAAYSADSSEHQAAGDDGAGGGSDFAAIDELEGEEYEEALARMPPGKQERYLRR